MHDLDLALRLHGPAWGPGRGGEREEEGTRGTLLEPLERGSLAHALPLSLSLSDQVVQHQVTLALHVDEEV